MSDKTMRLPAMWRFGLARGAIAAAILALAAALSGCSGSPTTAPSGTPAVNAAQHRGQSHVSCFGAAALAAPKGVCKPQRSGKTKPLVSKAAKDESDAYRGDGTRSDCFSHPSAFPLIHCRFADTKSRIRIALVGNSHAGQWLPTLERLAGPRRWDVTTYLASQCSFAANSQHFAGAGQHGCHTWVMNTIAAIKRNHFDLVVVTNRVSVAAIGTNGQPVSGQAASFAVYRRGYRNALHKVALTHTPVVVIHDTPAPGNPIPACLSRHRHDYAKCNGLRSRWLTVDPEVQAVHDLHSPRISAVDLSNRICGRKWCAAVVGGVVVYKDGSHMTATYARTLGRFLAPAVEHGLRLAGVA